MAKSQIKVEIPNMAQALADIRAAQGDVKAILRIAVEAGAETVADLATARAPGKIIYEMGKGGGEVRASADVGPPKGKFYYAFFETGAATHAIKPKNKKALLLAGGQIKARVSSHPGVAKRPFLRPAVDENVDKIGTAVGAPIKTELDKLNNTGGV
jgi:hypothetical protein